MAGIGGTGGFSTDGGMSSSDTCSTAPALNLSLTPPGLVTFTDTLVGSRNDVAFDCGDANEPDRFYQFTLASPAVVTATLQTTGWNGTVALFGAPCASNTALECGRSGAGSTRTLSALFQPGTYFIGVETDDGPPGPFTVTLSTVASPPGDTCFTPLPATFVGNTASVSASFAGLADNYPTSCGPNGVEAVLSFPTVVGDDYVVNVGDPGSPTVTVLSTSTPRSCGGSAVRACQDAGTSAARFTATSTGTQYVVVDTTTPGNLDATVVRTPRVPGDSCVAPATLQFASAPPLEVGVSYASVSGTTAGALKDATLSCAPTAQHDLVYRFSNGLLSTLAVNVASNTIVPRVAIYDGCNTGELTCRARLNDANSPSDAGVRFLEPGLHAIWVADNGVSGPFTLNAMLAVVPGESCGVPVVAIPPGMGFATHQGDLSIRSDHRSVSGSGCGITTGPDVVYAVTLASTRTLTAVLSRGTGSGVWRGAMDLQRTCSTSSIGSIACASGPSDGGVTALSQRLDAGTYYLWVDSYSGTGTPSPYQLVFSTTP